METKYYMHELIEKYYRAWVNGPTLLDHYLDRDRFFRFIKACIRYSRHWNAKQRIYGGWLEYFLERDLPKRYNDKQRCEEIIQEIIILFENILAFSKARFPDHVLEMRDPYLVSLELGSFRYTDKDGKEKRAYSHEEIEEILIKNFGPTWRKDWRA